MVESWLGGFLLNVVIGGAFVAIGLQLATRLTASRQWHANPIASVFTLVALSCGTGHAIRALLMAGPTLGLFGTAGVATRVEFADWHMWVADGATAMAGVFYVVARWRDRDILQTTRLFEDYTSRRRQALSLHDDVVQELNRAQIAIQADRDDDARTALDNGLRATQEIISGIESQPTETGETRSAVQEEAR